MAVGHEVVNPVLLLAALGSKLDCFFRVGQATGAIKLIEADAEGLHAVTVNDTCHLP